jgi:uncharacterized protein YbaP (TraB family)
MSCAIAFGACCLAAERGAETAAEPPHDAAADTPGADLAEILVTGEQPGPGMWRVSKGEHDLWILATLEPLPKQMRWRSQPVDSRIAASQVVLAPPGISVDVGFFRGLTLVPSLLRARKNPDGQTLEQVLPHDLYMRWLALKVKYLGRWSGDERLRPMVAAVELYTHAVEEAGLVSDAGIWNLVEESAHRHRVPIVPVTLKLPVDDPKGVIAALESVSRDSEVACLGTTIQRIETDLPVMVRRANLWSVGDIAGLRALPYADQRVACLDAVSTVPSLRDRFIQARGQLIDAWLAAADRALDANTSSFAVLPMREFLQPDGWLDQLRAKGYRIEEP